MTRNIVFIIDSFTGPWAGTERQLWMLIENLDRRRFQPVLVALRHSEYSRNTQVWPCEFKVIDISSLASFNGARGLIRLVLFLRKRKVGIVHAFFHDSSLIGPLAARLAGARFIAGRRDMGIWYTPACLRLLRMERRLVEHVIANSNAVKDVVADREGIAHKRISVIRNGLELETNDGASARFLNDDIPEDAPIIGIVANLRPVKRHADLIKAFAIVTREVPAAHLVLAGEGKLEQSLRKLAISLGVNQNTHFLGKVDAVAAVIRQFSVGVLCSESEGLSNALMECLGAGIPVVCSDTGGNPEMVTDGKNGYLYPVGDVKVLADRIVRLLKDSKLSDTMGMAAASSMRSMSIENMVAAHMVIYEALLHGDTVRHT